VLDQALAQRALQDKRVERLMTISGIHVTVALGLLAAIGDVSRFASSEKLVSYLGLNPSVRQSGDGPAHHGHISKHGRAHARAMLVEAAWAAARAPGPLRAFFIRIQSRRGQAGCGGRHGSRDRCPRVASAHQERELCLGTALPS
jgi:transposase